MRATAGSGAAVGIVGAMSLDSVITPQGTPVTAKVGGNALWSSLGALAAGAAPRLVAMVGEDYPSGVVERVGAAGVDVSAVVALAYPHPVRVTFAHLSDGGRIQPVPDHLLAGLPQEVRAHFVDTTSRPDVLPLGTPRPCHIPDAWLYEVDAWHLPLAPLTRHRPLVHHLATHARGRLQSDCPARSDLVGDPITRLGPTLSAMETFLPSTSDLDVITPGQPWQQVVESLRAAGARGIVVKAGAQGSFVVGVDGPIWHVPAVDVPVVDPTGAGDTYCGAFAAVLAATDDPVEAACWGAAAASFAIGVHDPLALVDIPPHALATRAGETRAGVRTLTRTRQ